jgi:NTP pyrophosphatase (non-canonical NTP hydrolase)
MHEHKTFAAALLALAEESPERARALKAHDSEPLATRHADGAMWVTFRSQVFTLVFHRSPTARTWGYTWTWTDTATR